MALTRTLGVTLVVAFAAGLLASSAPAVVRPASDHTLTTTHFVVHYYTDVNPASDVPGKDYSTETQAGDIGAYAEQAYNLFTSWGYTPKDDGGPDHKIDIYLTDLSGPPALKGYVLPDGTAPTPAPDSGMIVLATPDELQTGFTVRDGLSLADEEQLTVANELFVLSEFATSVPSDWGDYWLIDGSAQWAGFEAIGNPSGSAVTGLGPPDIALNCRDDLSNPIPPLLPFRMCDPDRFVELGYTRWAFFQMLANKYGTSFVHTVLENAALGQSATTALSNAIAAKGSSLASVFNEYAMRLMDGGFGVSSLANIRPPASASLVVGTATATLPMQKVSANHLSARYVTFQRGDGDGSHPCFAATLSISVTIPSGTSAQPYLFWDAAGSVPQALSVSGSTASITVPWDTCDWGLARGWLSIPNASTTIDAATFTVTGSVTVDLNTPATATAPPSPTSVWGTTVPVPTSDVPPSIDVFGPELLQLSANDPTIRLIVESSGPGMLTATLGSTVLGSGSLRSGNNDLRFAVPKGMLTSLRRSASDANVLTLTPASPTGSATGAPVMLHVVIAAAPKAKKHTKHKKK